MVIWSLIKMCAKYSNPFYILHIYIRIYWYNSAYVMFSFDILFAVFVGDAYNFIAHSY